MAFWKGRVNNNGNGHQPQNNELRGVSANLFKSFIGSNYLSIPSAFAHAGWALGSGAFVVVAASTLYSIETLVYVKTVLQDAPIKAPGKPVLLVANIANMNVDNGDKDKDLTYADVGKQLFGNAGAFSVNAALVITQAGFCVLYVIFVSQTMEDIRIPLTLNKTTWALALAPVFFILTLYRNVKVLAPASAVANVFILLGFFVVLEEEVRHVREQGFSQEIEANRPQGLGVFLGVVTSAFEGIGTVLPIANSIPRQERETVFPPMLRSAVVSVSVLLGGFGLLGYCVHGSGTTSPVTHSLDNDAPALVLLKGLMVVGVILTFPLQIYPVTTILDEMILGVCCDTGSTNSTSGSGKRLSNVTTIDMKPSWVRSTFMPMYSWQGVLRICLVALITFIGCVTENFGAFAGLVGSVGASALSFIFPILFSFKLAYLRENPIPAFKVFIHVSVLILGVVGGGVGAVLSLRELIQQNPNK
eukprot:m.11452 g.11452  ORF g.11452 m.11452 type:complete len:474 (-) comp4444_c0_seq1:141-1562(-)